MAGRKQDAFQQLVAQLFREREKHPHLTVVLLRQHWPAILGEELAARTYPARLSRDTLWINAADAGWAYQLQFMKADLLHAIHVFTGSQAIRELRFRQGEVPWPAPGEEPADAGTGETGEAAPGEGVEPAAKGGTASVPEPEPPPEAEAIGDPSLRRSFARWRSGLRRKRRAADPPTSGS